jgi:hypothetical protein
MLLWSQFGLSGGVWWLLVGEESPSSLCEAVHVDIDITTQK